jgi:BRO family, N-terminal domain
MSSNESSLVPFGFEGRQIRAFTDEQGDPWFVGADVCSVLGIGNPRQAMNRLDEDEKGVISTDTPGGEQSMTTISEPGLYSLVLGSCKPAARGLKAKDTIRHLAACELQISNQRGEWELTDTGRPWGEALPYCRGTHSGNQILGNPAVADVLRELG